MGVSSRMWVGVVKVRLSVRESGMKRILVVGN